MSRARTTAGSRCVSVILAHPGFALVHGGQGGPAEAFAEWRFRVALILLALLVALSAGLGGIGLIAWQRQREGPLPGTLPGRGRRARQRGAPPHHVDEHRRRGHRHRRPGPGGAAEPGGRGAHRLDQSEARGRPLEEVFRIVNEETRRRWRTRWPGSCARAWWWAWPTTPCSSPGTAPSAPSPTAARPSATSRGDHGVVLVFRDQTEERRAQRLIQARIDLVEYAFTHSLEELLTKALDEIGALVDSPIGFYHFVDADQKTLSLSNGPPVR